MPSPLRGTNQRPLRRGFLGLRFRSAAAIADAIADDARLRSEDRQIALDRMVRYAESGECRWSMVQNYFEISDRQETECGCDNCGRQTHHAA